MKFIKTYEHDLPEEVCSNLIGSFESREALHEPLFGHRDFNEINIMRDETMKKYAGLLVEYAMRGVKRYIEDCNIDRVDFPTELAMEEFRMKRYDEGSVGFTHHVDANNLESAKRYLVFFWYLNVVEEGGETKFIGRELSVKPEIGKMLMFPPLWTYPHSGEPIVKGTKYIVGGYLSYV